MLLEYEGEQHLTDKRQWGIDPFRYAEFTNEGWTVLRVNAERMRYARSVVQRTYEAISAGGYTGPAPNFGAEWRRLFE